ncbi:MAG: response regulator [Eubacteriales bacterium]|nr:response regulator [Eubacteriales bacterium]
MRKIRLMIVDDEPLVRALIRASLDWEALGIEIVAEAGSGEEALERIPFLKPDILLLDICMSGISGVELAEQVMDIAPELYIVVISGHDTFRYVQQCLRLGVSDYLLKPVNEEQLEKALRAIIRKISPETLLGAQSRKAVRDVVDCLYQNYRDPELSLQTVAERLYLNPSYISRAFHEDTGESFVEALTRLRMEEARRLLKTTALCGYEIGEKVGIPDGKYFGACFKKYTGLTVREYRQEHCKK